MSRRRIEDQPVSHERWLVSYADFITLLFAFFVVMYSISQVNEGKYKVLSETLAGTFAPREAAVRQRSLDPIQIGEVALSNPLNFIPLEPSVIVESDPASAETTEPLTDKAVEDPGELPAEFQQINDQLDEVFGDLMQQELITVRGNEQWLEVELKSSLLFSSGDARLSTPALELLASIADILKDQPNPVRVEGFTDNLPINTLQFPSNWELSSFRASAVVQLFIEEGLAPDRLAAIGYGEFQPVADNITAEGRAANRRVVLMISKTGELRPALRELTTTAQLSSQINEKAAEKAFVGFEIIIPGVNDKKAEANTNTNTNTNATGNSLQGVKGIRTIELNDGGLLFTNDVPRNNE